MEKNLSKILRIDLKPTHLLVLFLSSVAIIGLFFFLLRSFKKESSETASNFQENRIEVKEGDNLLVVNKNGSVKLKTPEGNFSDHWEAGKVDSFFRYFEEKFQSQETENQSGGFMVTLYFQGKGQTINLDANDELLNLVINEVIVKGDEGGQNQGTDEGGGSGDGGGGGEEEDIISYFRQSPEPSSFPSPLPSGSSNPASSTPQTIKTPQPSSWPGPTASSPSIKDLCPYWRLSYCVYPPSPLPSISIPNKVYAPDCELWQKQVSKRTVISNTICIEKP